MSYIDYKWLIFVLKNIFKNVEDKFSFLCWMVAVIVEQYDSNFINSAAICRKLLFIYSDYTSFHNETFLFHHNFECNVINPLFSLLGLSHTVATKTATPSQSLWRVADPRLLARPVEPSTMSLLFRLMIQSRRSGTPPEKSLAPAETMQIRRWYSSHSWSTCWRWWMYRPRKAVWSAGWIYRREFILV